MAIEFDVWSDYACPWCFLFSVTLEKLNETRPVNIKRRAYELRPAGSPPIPPEYEHYIKTVGQPQLKAMAREQYGLELKAGKLGINTRPALCGAKYADARDKGAEYHRAVFRAHWLAGADIADEHVLADLAESVGLDRSEFLEAIASAETDLAVTIDIRRAEQYNITSVPATIINNQYMVSGAQPYDTMLNIIAEVEGTAGPSQG